LLFLNYMNLNKNFDLNFDHLQFHKCIGLHYLYFSKDHKKY